MTQPIPIFQEQETFYVPYFEIRIQNERLPNNIIRDVMQVTYRDSTNDIDSFDLTINNYDATTRTHKYEGALPSNSSYRGIFDPGKRIELYMGYRGQRQNVRKMLVGVITTVEPTFNETGSTTLSVRGQNVLFLYKKKQHTYSWDGKKDSEIAHWIGQQRVTDERPGLGVEVRVNSEAQARETPETHVFMNNQYDIVFLIERARRRGYSVFLEYDEQTQREYISFGPSLNIRDITYKLEWGKSLIQVRPTLTTVNQVSQVTVRGWNRRTGRPIVGHTDLNDRHIRISPDQRAIAEVVQHHEIVTDRPVHTEAEARQLARDILQHQLHEMVKVDASTVGLPDLRAGRKVHLARLGPRYSGQYFITETTHVINESGYRTSFKAKREAPLPNTREEVL